mmetsp:Transcript_14371/g.13869  ORF Transcript_14371/g.13869 Transcript_14371/m.13869 type:complete len:371 (+) Transcript_14371:147-1259(+)
MRFMGILDTRWIFFVYLLVCNASLNGNEKILNENGNENGNDVETSIFPPMFVMNLKRSTDRWIESQKQMNAEGLTVERFDAIDGRALSEAELRNSSTRIAMFLQPRGVIGCYLSHRKFWQMVVDRNLDHAIIFEDDVKLVDNFKDKLQDHLTLFGQEKYDVVLLGAIGRVHPEGKDGFGTRIFSAYIGGTRPLKRISEHLYQPRRPAGTHAYMVSQEGARKLLKLCTKAVFHVDLDAWRHPSLIMRMFHPMLAYQTFESTSLTDVKTHRKGGMTEKFLHSEPITRLQEWAIDSHTQQPWSHVLAEPLLQLGPRGLVITVERHFAVLLWGTCVASVLRTYGKTDLSNIVLTSMVALTLTVRSLIWALMTIK